MDTIKEVLQGYSAFKEEYFKQHTALFQQLTTEGQHPKIMLVMCADSRITPDLIFGLQPGDMFVLRNIANLVHHFQETTSDFSTRAAIEYAVQHLQIKHIVVLGHSSCGGIRALIQQAQQQQSSGQFIDPWLACASPVAERVIQTHADASLQQQCYHCELASIQHSLNNLESYPWIQNKLSSTELELHGWHFDISCGELLCYDKVQQKFIPHA